MQIGAIPETILQKRFEETTQLFHSIPTASWKEINDIFEKIDNTYLVEYLRMEVRKRITLGSYFRYESYIFNKPNFPIYFGNIGTLRNANSFYILDK